MAESYVSIGAYLGLDDIASLAVEYDVNEMLIFFPLAVVLSSMHPFLGGNNRFNEDELREL